MHNLIMTILKIVGSNIKKYRTDKGLSQEKLGEAAEVHRTFIGAIERGERNISILTLKKISSALEIPITKLLEDETCQ